jgi:hypothetical protein
MTFYEPWVEIAKKLPGGFAGIYLHNGKPVIMLTRIDEAKAAKAAIARALPGLVARCDDPLAPRLAE